MGNELENTLGRVYEALAAEHLLRLGYEIVERNYRTRWAPTTSRSARHWRSARSRLGGRAGRAG